MSDNHILEAKNVCKSFGGLSAVNDVSTSIRKGEIFGIIGPNGAGKTTFLNLIGGSFPTSSGEIHFDGQNITNQASYRISRKGISRTFQNIQLFNSMSVLENVIVGFHTSEKSNMADAILHTKRFRSEQVQIREKGIALLQELDLQDFTDTIASGMSYGMQRKVEIARALATNPKILLLDEPAAGMNQQETRELLEFIQMINRQGYTIILIEHDIKFVLELCNRIMVLNFGQKICEGTPDEVKNNQDVITAYFGKGRAASQGGI